MTEEELTQLMNNLRLYCESIIEIDENGASGKYNDVVDKGVEAFTKIGELLRWECQYTYYQIVEAFEDGKKNTFPKFKNGHQYVNGKILNQFSNVD